MKTLEELLATKVEWYASNDEENYHCGPFATREDAMAEALADELSVIAETWRTPIRVSAYFDAATFLATSDEDMADLANEDGDPLLDFKAVVVADLQVRVRRAIDEWQVAHQLAPVTYCFDRCNPEPVTEAPMAGAIEGAKPEDEK